ncbi:MAG TPA: hypothetical protein PK801_14680 [Aggregatilineales bacterium]|jgi:Tfp pilus assembly protein PilV|nr:hypothetical protein [Aggregatilineales bacterium]HPV08471.1 hypothetical protein [Aggregatilineales bacterium]HQA69568.1 hypothetical protein [Aggregatilineales bacterium]HQE19304.1 hypothetical protein [Aggregatilineales bacterium]
MVASVLVLVAGLALAGLVAQALREQQTASKQVPVPIPVESEELLRRRRRR